MATENDESMIPENDEIPISESGNENANYQVLCGTARTLKDYPDGSMIRACGIDFSWCTREGDDLIKLIERGFTELFKELHGGYEPNLKLDMENGIFRYDLKSSLLPSDQWFGFNTPGFKPADCNLIIKRLMTHVNSERAFRVFRSKIMVGLLYCPKK